MDELWGALAELAKRTGAAPVNQFGGCWEKKLDQQWAVAINGHGEPKMLAASFWTTLATVPAFCLYAEFNGWPAGIASPIDGWMAEGDAANIRTLIAAIKSATPRD